VRQASLDEVQKIRKALYTEIVYKIDSQSEQSPEEGIILVIYSLLYQYEEPKAGPDANEIAGDWWDSVNNFETIDESIFCSLIRNYFKKES
jgi:hypothetical protein